MDKKSRVKVNLALSAVVAVVMLVLDRVTKLMVVRTLSGTEAKPVIPKVFSLSYVLNDGAGFSVLGGRTAFLIAFTAVMIVACLLVIILRISKSILIDWGLMLVVSGGLGNLYDRIFNHGLVVDFIRTDFINFPVFNVADICVTVGAGLIVLSLIIDLIRSKNGNADEQ